MTENLLYVGTAAGKIFEFMKCGVPLVSNELPGMRALIEGNSCGVVVRGPEEIRDALKIVDDNYSAYRKNCFKAFPKYDFGKKYDEVLHKIRMR